MKLKKITIAALAAITMSAGAMGITASAGNSLTINTSSATLTNGSGATRYANVNFIVINRASGAQVNSAGNSGNIANNSSITATKSGYSALYYRFKGNGTLFNGTSQYSGVLWTSTVEY